MPLNDGKMLLNTLHNEKNCIDLAYAAQIYFPGEQMLELTAILTDLSTDKRRPTGRYDAGRRSRVVR